MSKVRLALGVEFPNITSHWKTQGTGNAGLADGWTANAAAVADLTFSRIPLTIGWNLQTSDPAGADPFLGGYALAVSIPASLGASDRDIISPRSPAGQFFGTENFMHASWLYRLYVRFRVTETIGLGNLKFFVRVYNAARTRWFDLCTLTVSSGQMNGAWQYISDDETLTSSGWQGGGSGDNPDHAELFIRVSASAAGSTRTLYFQSALLQTMAPIDVGQQSDSAVFGNPYYQLSRDMDFQGLATPRLRTFSKSRRLASGAMRTFDPSGGASKLDFTLPFRYLSHTDMLMLARLYLANRGYGIRSGTNFGLPLPLVIHTQLDGWDVGRYVDITDEVFPITAYDNTWRAAGASAQLYRGAMHLSER